MPRLTAMDEYFVHQIPELLPKLYRDEAQGYRRKLRIPLGEARRIPEGVRIHASVFAGDDVKPPRHQGTTEGRSGR